MDSFDEWAKSSTQHPSVQNYVDRLIELGASWDTFLSREPSDIAADLVQGGIPLLAARDIVDVARAAAQQSHAPLAIFWDLENMQIPATSSGRDVSSRLKSILKPYGDLKEFRGYASIGLNLIPQQKRSDLQLSGCLLVDCPHNGRKEVADKMIIVDAMNFAMNNREGATLCFVTGDVDYAYLLAVLQRYKQYRTIVISKGTLQSMLDVNCDMKMRWETDILQLRSVSTSSNAARDLLLASSDKPAAASPEDAPVPAPFEPLTKDEEWIDDVNFLRNLIRSKGSSLDGGVRKSLVGVHLRQMNPARFPHREVLKSFLAEAIEKGVVLETGEGAFKELRLPTDETSGMFPAISLSEQIPMPLAEIPERVITAAASRPYVLFVKWKFCPPGAALPSHAYIQQKDSWGIFMFGSLIDAQRTVSELLWLRNGILVDWQKVSRQDASQSTTLAASATAVASSLDERSCVFCRASRSDVEMKRLENGDGFSCPECVAWKVESTEAKTLAANKVCDMLEMMARNDDIKVSEDILRKQLHVHEGLGCESRKWAALWIEHSIEIGAVVRMQAIGGTKGKMLCLAAKLDDASRPFPPDELDTRDEEAYVLNILRERPNGWISREVLIDAVHARFPLMSHPYLRSKILINAYRKNLMFVAKSAYGQTVGLSQMDADCGLGSLIQDRLEKSYVDSSDTMVANGKDAADDGHDCKSDEGEVSHRLLVHQ